MKSKLLPIVAGLLIALSPASVPAAELPVIGDSSSSLISLDDEYRLGQAWVRVLRAQAPQLNDPFVYSYVEDLIFHLVANSNLQDTRLTLAVLKNDSLNAFAVPGGIIGVHAGLFRYAETESQFASVLAHEISHLSQRHYAASLEQQRQSLPMQVAAILGGILLAASTNGDGAVAAIASGQAALQDQRLAFSRQNEREADNLGMEVLVKSGFDPQAMPNMFAQMQKSARFVGDRPPEFLLTHPVTESRIADSLSRAAQLAAGGRSDSQDYQLIRARVNVALSSDPNGLYHQYRQALPAAPTQTQHYALALMAMASNHLEEAKNSVDWLLQQAPDKFFYQVLQAEWWLAADQPQRAQQQLSKQLQLYPDNHPLTVLLVRSLRKQELNQQAAELLKKHLRLYPDNSYLWYELAESYGLVNNILGVHRARAEYFLLIGATKKAEEHLKLALRVPGLNEQEQALIKARLEDTLKIRESMDF